MKLPFLLLVAALVLGACVNVHVHFPAAPQGDGAEAPAGKTP